jgi:lipopolysaccharide transport system permease protein
VAAGSDDRIGVWDLGARLRRHHQLLWELVRRDLTDKHAGQLLGAAWTIGHPLVLTAVYLFVFVIVLPARSGESPAPESYVIAVLAGLVPWLAAQDSFLRGVVSVFANANLVKQVIFPIELLPLKGVLAALVPPLVMTAGLIVFLLASGRGVPWTLALLPGLWVVQVVGAAGVCFALAAVGAYFRDLRELVQLFCLVNLYLMPVFYTPAAMPESIRFLPYINPFSYGVWCYQDAWSGTLAHPAAWVVFPVTAVLALVGGYRVFRAARPYFGNVL